MEIIRFAQKTLLYLLLLAGLTSCNNNTGDHKSKTVAATNTPTASYYLQTPMGWTTERISFPIDFAPAISYKGTEDLRFAKGWGDINSDEHWCYAFVWWLDGKPAINEMVLQQNLTEYYNGLVKRNIIERKIPQNKVIPTEVIVKKIATTSGDIVTYTGTIQMLDYLDEKPILLNCTIHVKSCDTKDHTALLFQISPKPRDHAAWKPLEMLNLNFSCGK
ncbi:MAG: hypothetical protein JWP81_4634 [Ferruginibacter sp.]|nr:hypothetical protein [Ferruginibacter sp.]